MPREPLKDRARGRWTGILTALGAPSAALTGRHAACPMCGGKDRFRFDNKDGRGTWICSCGHGDGVGLVQAMLGCDFRNAAIRIEEQIGESRIDDVVARPSAPKQLAAMNDLWKRSNEVGGETPAGLYLDRRCETGTVPPALRSVIGARFSGPPVSFHPAMLAMITDGNGKPVNIHRTFLTMDGHKASIDQPKRLMSGPLPPGSAVQLCEAVDEIGIAEGIETALSASSLFGIPCWAAINAAMLERWMPPAPPRRVVIFGDNDASFTGQAAGYALAKTLKSKGLMVSIEIPPKPDTDWNDVHMERRAKA